MSALSPEQLNSLMFEARQCLIALTPGCATFVDDDENGAPSPSIEQAAWYFGFIYGWGATKIREFGQDDVDLNSAFVLRVFENLFEPRGDEIFDALVERLRGGLLGGEVNEAIKEYEGWDGGEFVPLPPAT
jgi:hypothetical protein